MNIQYSDFAEAFLLKVTEYKFLALPHEDRDALVLSYMKNALMEFNKECMYDLVSALDDDNGVLLADIDPRDAQEIIDVVSDGMLAYWMKPYLYCQENYENVLNTRDFSTFSPAALTAQIRESYKTVSRDFRNKIYMYSYYHGDLTDLHL